MKKIFLFLLIFLTACNTAEPLPTLAPTLAPKQIEVTKPSATTMVMPPTAAPLPTTPALNTPALASVPAAVPLKGEVTLWHTYEADEVEEKTFLQLIDVLKKKNPELKINLRRFPAYDVASVYRAAVKVGNVPDLLLASNDDLGEYVRENAVLDLAPYQARLNAVAPYALDSFKVSGKLYALPESANTVVLYYNKALIDKAPATTEELLNAVKNKKQLAAVSGAYHLFGFFPAFGGKILDQNNKCIADAGGFAEAMQYFADLEKAGATLEAGDPTLATTFLEGKTAMLINTTWAFTDYKKVLGDKLGVAPLPANKNKAAPWVNVDGFYVNPKSKVAPLAVEVALALTTLEAAQMMMDQAGHIPVRTDVNPDLLMTVLARAAAEGTVRPPVPELQNYWSPFNELFVRVLDLKTSPAEAVKQACAIMNKANGK